MTDFIEFGRIDTRGASGLFINPKSLIAIRYIVSLGHKISVFCNKRRNDQYQKENGSMSVIIGQMGHYGVYRLQTAALKI